MAGKVNYLNNKELLKEIHRSKMSFSYIEDKKYYLYDVILHSLDDVDAVVDHAEDGTPITNLDIAKQTHANRIAVERFTDASKVWEDDPNSKAKDKPKQISFKFDGSEIDKDQIVLRVMTFEHVPLEPGRKNKPKTVADHHAKCNFPPFKHYAWRNNQWEEVARSHWSGDLTDGKFSVKKGRITEKLASMMIMLCKRYSMRSNWRGYTYVDEMRSYALVQLSQIGLYFDESKSDNPFAYYTAAITNSFTRVLNIEKRNQNIRDDLLQEMGRDPSYTRQLDNEEEHRLAREARASETTDANIEEEMKNAGYNV